MTALDFIKTVGREFRRRPYLIGFAVALAGLIIWAIVVPLPKRAVKRVIVQGTKALEARDIESLRPLLAANFESPRSGDRDKTLETLTDDFRHVVSIRIKLKHIRIRLEGERATADVEFYISGSFRTEEYPQVPFRGLSGDASLGNPLERWRLLFTREADGLWRLSGAEPIEPPPAGSHDAP
jgi:hypothetical protein